MRHEGNRREVIMILAHNWFLGGWATDALLLTADGARGSGQFSNLSIESGTLQQQPAGALLAIIGDARDLHRNTYGHK